MISRMRGSALRAIAASAAAVTSCSRSMIMGREAPVASIELLDRDRNTLADTDAHGGERELAAALLKTMHRGQRQPRAAHAEGMAKRDRAAMRIDEIGNVLDAELTQAGDALGGESFVELDQVEIADLDAEPFHLLLRCRHRADAHDAR